MSGASWFQHQRATIAKGSLFGSFGFGICFEFGTSNFLRAKNRSLDDPSGMRVFSNLEFVWDLGLGIFPAQKAVPKMIPAGRL